MKKQERNIIIFITSSLKRRFTPEHVKKIFETYKIYDKINSISEIDYNVYEIRLNAKKINDYIYIHYNYFGATILDKQSLKNDSLNLINAMSYTYYEDGKEIEYYPEIRKTKSVI